MTNDTQEPKPGDLPEDDQSNDGEPEDVWETGDEVDDRVQMINHLLAQHAGGIELSDIDSEGRVTVKFVGMCTGCLYRPITMAATIRPALMEIEGVTDVMANGSRIDDAARERLEADIGRWWKPLKIARSDGTEVTTESPAEDNDGPTDKT